jgi:Mn2+/Fe2+ NRAMP family transporter
VQFDASRLRRGELIAGGGAVVLALALFVFPFYGVTNTFAPTLASEGQATSFDGWHSVPQLRWLLLVVILVALALVCFQAVMRAPAVPVTFSMIVTVLSLLALLGLLWRVLIDPPGSPLDERYGAYVSLIAALAMFYGGFLSMRQEGVADRDARTQIETVRLRGTGTREPAA